MIRSARSVLLAFFLLVSAAQAAPTQAMRLQLGNLPAHPVIVIRAGREVYLNVADTAWLRWYPVIDDLSGLVDFAGCLRFAPHRQQVLILGGFPLFGAATVTAAAPLRSTWQGTRLPLLEVADRLGFQVQVDEHRRLIRVVQVQQAWKRPDLAYLTGCQQLGQPLKNPN